MLNKTLLIMGSVLVKRVSDKTLPIKGSVLAKRVPDETLSHRDSVVLEVLLVCSSNPPNIFVS